MVRVRLLVTAVALAGVLPSIAAATGPSPPSRAPGRTGLAESASRVEATEVPAGTAIRLDGEFTEAAWERAVPITGFVQREPKEGATPSSPT
jgi:hypothetical protein